MTFLSVFFKNACECFINKNIEVYFEILNKNFDVLHIIQIWA